MASPHRIAPDHLEAFGELRREPYRFSLFAAMRLVERSYASSPRLGEARRPADEAIRCEQPPHLNFAPNDVATFAPNARGRLRLEQYGFGVFGPNGALPHHLSEHAFERRRHHDDATVSDFINLFQHRLTTLFYRAWAASDPSTSRARPDDDEFAAAVGALVGLFGPATLGRETVPDDAKLGLAGRYAPSVRSADGLEAILMDYFQLPVSIRQFVGSWLPIPPESRTRLGVRGPSATLGDSATLGAASWQCQGRFEVTVGPLTFEQFLGFTPGSRALREMSTLIRYYTTDEWSWHARLLVAEQNVPGVSLGQVGRLGWTSWLGRKRDLATDVVVQGA